jgi:hypothetical protein
MSKIIDSRDIMYDRYLRNHDNMIDKLMTLLSLKDVVSVPIMDLSVYFDEDFEDWSNRPKTHKFIKSMALAGYAVQIIVGRCQFPDPVQSVEFSAVKNFEKQSCQCAYIVSNLNDCAINTDLKKIRYR